MKPFAPGTIKLLFHSRGNFEIQTDLTGLLHLADQTKLVICKGRGNCVANYGYEPVRAADLRKAWDRLNARNTDAAKNTDKIYRVFAAHYLVSEPGDERRDLSTLGAVITPDWRYVDGLHTSRIWWYLSVSLAWDDKPLSPTAVRLLDYVEKTPPRSG